MADPLLKRGEGGLLRPAAGSPVLGAAIGWYPQVDHDIDGQWRNDPKDVGCDQRVDEPILNRPLTPADVGAVWARAPEPVALIHPAIDAGMFRFRFISRHSRTHTVLYKESLEDAWQTLSILPGDGSEKTVSDPVSGPQRFYIVETE